jgi:hypothetical protein
MIFRLVHSAYLSRPFLLARTTAYAATPVETPARIKNDSIMDAVNDAIKQTHRSNVGNIISVID